MDIFSQHMQLDTVQTTGNEKCRHSYYTRHTGVQVTAAGQFRLPVVVYIDK